MTIVLLQRKGNAR